MFSNYVAVLKKYVEFGGRADRPEFWWFVLANLIVTLLVGFVAKIIGIPALSTIYSLAVLLPCLAVGARRLRDAGFSPWLLLLSIPSYVFSIGALMGMQWGAAFILMMLSFSASIALIVLWIMPTKK